VPEGAGPIGTQTGLPVEQEICPRSQALPVAHGAPALQPETHMPRPSQLPPEHVVLELAKPFDGQIGLAPVQDSATSHVPAAARQTVVLGASASAGQTSELPVQRSARSQSPVAARHTAVAGA
jgi:hypothetical protein